MSEHHEPFNYIAFLEGLAVRINTLKELRKVYDEQMAFDFIATRFFQPNENKFSEILAFFLDPSESHGQGNTFLRIFCENFLQGQPQIDGKELSQPIMVRTEHTTDLLPEESRRRRIDITIQFGSDFIVGIENKIGAGDQPKQIDDYCEDMKCRCNNYLCFYLTPDGNDPSESSIESGKREKYKEAGLLRCISYREDINNLLEQWAVACKAPPVEAFIRDFQKYIQHEHTGERNMAIEQSIAKYLTGNESYMEVALHIYQNINVVREKIWEKVTAELIEVYKDSVTVSDNWWGGKDKEYVCIVIKGEHIKGERHEWSLFFAGHGYALCREVDFPEQNIPDEKLSEIMTLLSLRWHAQEPSRVGGDAREYAADWEKSVQPWMDMLTKQDGAERSVFVENIMKCHNQDKAILQEFFGQNRD